MKKTLLQIAIVTSLVVGGGLIIAKIADSYFKKLDEEDLDDLDTDFSPEEPHKFKAGDRVITKKTRVFGVVTDINEMGVWVLPDGEKAPGVIQASELEWVP